jgi:phosphoglycolate phosphatase-like HAD superfamily hydrolase
MSKYRKISENISVNEESISKFKNLECAIFDCDGTLVNINNSYNACIKKTVGFILERLIGGKQWYELVSDELILKFRMSGGFNNDTDTSYVSILAALASGSNNVVTARNFALHVASNATPQGIRFVEQYLEKSGYSAAVKKAKSELNYPGLVGISTLSTVFDELFYGKELFIKLHHMQPSIINSKGFIDEDEVVISDDTVRDLSKLFKKKMAIVSGRSRLATEYSLKNILRNFNLDASVFLEDEEKEVIVNNLTIRVNKPEPYALLKAMKALNAKSAISVGDSAEDIIMSRKVGEKYSIVFCGVYGTGIDSAAQFNMFMDRGADAIIENVNLLPTLLTSTIG